MRIVPAVDIRNGRCVNLVQGDYGRETVFSLDPVSQAVKWYEEGAELVHIVDLDGAKAGHVCVADELRALHEAGVPVEVGGGIRTFESIETVLNTGASRVILGTVAHEDPALVRRAAEAFPGQIVAGIDARDGKVALRGWLDETDTSAEAFALQMEEAGVSRIIYTDILSDGMMQGPNIEATRAVAEAVSIPVTVSGGISSLEDIGRVRALADAGVDEIIVGRALYLGAFELQEAISRAQALA